MDQRPISGQRPSVITAVGVLMYIAGGLSILGGIIAVFGGGFYIGFGGGALILFGILSIALGALQIWAASGIMRLREQARMVGLVLAVIGVVLTLANLVSGAPSGILPLLIDGFIIWALVTNKELFA